MSSTETALIILCIIMFFAGLFLGNESGYKLGYKKATNEGISAIIQVKGHCISEMEKIEKKCLETQIEIRDAIK